MIEMERENESLPSLIHINIYCMVAINISCVKSQFLRSIETQYGLCPYKRENTTTTNSWWSLFFLFKTQNSTVLFRARVYTRSMLKVDPTAFKILYSKEKNLFWIRENQLFVNNIVEDGGKKNTNIIVMRWEIHLCDINQNGFWLQPMCTLAPLICITYADWISVL